MTGMAPTVPFFNLAGDASAHAVLSGTHLTATAKSGKGAAAVGSAGSVRPAFKLNCLTQIYFVSFLLLFLSSPVLAGFEGCSLIISLSPVIGSIIFTLMSEANIPEDHFM